MDEGAYRARNWSYSGSRYKKLQEVDHELELDKKAYKRLAMSWSFLLAANSEVRRLVSMRPEIF